MTLSFLGIGVNQMCSHSDSRESKMSHSVKIMHSDKANPAYPLHTRGQQADA